MPITYAAMDQAMGEVDFSVVDPAGPGPFNPQFGAPIAGTTLGRSSFYLEELRGFSPQLGGFVAMYAQFGANIVAGSIIELTPTLVNGRIVPVATLWQGVANSGRKLAVAIANGVQGQWGWFQVDGHAIVNVSGTPAAGSPVYWQAPGVVSGTAVASKQVMGANFASTNGITLGTGNSAVVLPATQAVLTISRPACQGAIT